MEERWFSISIEGDGYSWASGGTDSLLTVVEVLEAWQGGVRVRELSARFPFMHYDELAEARESGDPVSFQWNRLVEDEQFSSVWPLLRQLRSNSQLRALFPFLSRGTLRLAKDYSDRAAGEIFIMPLRDGRYRIESTDPRSEEMEVASMEEVTDAALSVLGSL
ncbi:DUF6193 family natural product biosynthesis protein [Streptomyces sp. NPDC057743]|uniref:DUF6193 family natural product biosynthesis protein n=1 Tax=Streptomyces sp. NPDC057743 TaxID=3346236 RepID=UPI0036A272C0